MNASAPSGWAYQVILGNGHGHVESGNRSGQGGKLVTASAWRAFEERKETGSNRGTMGRPKAWVPIKGTRLVIRIEQALWPQFPVSQPTRYETTFSAIPF